MAPEVGAVFAPVTLFDFEGAPFATQQLAQQSFVWRKIVGINFAATLAANFTTDFMTMFRIEFASVRTGQFLLAVAQQYTNRGISFRNPAINLPKPSPKPSPF